MELLDSWAAYRPDSAPFVLPADRDVLESERSRKAIVIRRSWKEAASAPDFCAQGDTRLHLGLLPMPFIGDLRTATIYILLLNPGLSPHDYYGESEVLSYREAVLANLAQSPRHEPFLFLDPALAWHAGFSWWHGKLAKVIAHLASVWGLSFAAARSRLGRTLASIELFPYHSAAFKDSGGWLRGLPSVRLARSFVAEHVMTRVRAGEAIAVVTRRVSDWNLPDLAGVVTYCGAEARSAHLTPSSRGGRAIIEHLTRR
jgi:hypothetical protein